MMKVIFFCKHSGYAPREIKNVVRFSVAPAFQNQRKSYELTIRAEDGEEYITFVPAKDFELHSITIENTEGTKNA